jgi:hypothetical protein
MSRARAVERCAGALAILDGVLGEGLGEDVAPDITAAVGLIEEALDELEPSGRAASLFLGVPT